ncbi:MAG: leucine-rich repeat protein [Clostridia bacterium]|nr:leucine-rich repeat protein [Clostridia bacterium]
MRKVISVVLAIAMVMSMFGMTAFAEDVTSTNVWSDNYVTWLSAGEMLGTGTQAPPAEETGFVQPSATLAEDNTYVGTKNYYQKAAFYGADTTTVLYAGTASDSDAKVVLGATNYSHYTGTDKGYTENDRLAFTMYVNLVSGSIGNVYFMRPSAGVECSQDAMGGYLNSHKGEWVKLDAFIQPKITYTYTRTNISTGVAEEGLVWERIGFVNPNKGNNVAGALESMTGYDASTYTYTVTKVTYGKMSSYINGECVKNEVELSGTSGNVLAYGADNVPSRMAFVVKDMSEKVSLYVSHAQVYKVSNFDADTLELDKSPVLADGDKYDVVNKAVVLGSDSVTVADIATSDDCIVNVYAASDTAYSSPKASDYVISADDKIVVRKGTLDISYYTATEAAEDNEFTDDYGNTYTWSFAPYTGVLSIGAVEEQKSNENYGVIKFAALDVSGRTTLPADVFPWLALSNKSEITDIEIDSSITRIEREMFNGLTGLKDIYIPGTINSWGWGVFSGCTGLQKVEFGYGAKNTGGDKMFAGCSNLSQVILPPTVYAVSGRSFWNCKSLKELMITAAHGELSISSNAFGADNEANGLNITLKYYQGSDAAADVTAVTSPANSTITTQAVAAAGLLPDGSGNADSIGWKVENGVATIYDIPEVGTGELPKGNTGHSSKGSLPWCYFGALDEVVVEEGITKLSQWSMQDITATTVTIPSTVSASDPYVFNGTNPITNLIFKEGCSALGQGQMINRTCNITNIYLPSTATVISDKLVRGLHKDDGDEYTGTATVNFIAPKDSYAHTWATNMAANKTTDKEVTINVKSESDRLYTYAASGYTSTVAAANGSLRPAVGADGEYDTAYEVYSTVASQNNAFISGPNYDRTLFAKRAYTVFEADVKFGEEANYMMFGSNQHSPMSQRVNKNSALTTDDWNKVVTVVDYNTGTSKTYVNGILCGENTSSLWKDGGQDSNGNICTSTRFVVYATADDTKAAAYIDNMAIYATDVNPADSYATPLTASAYDAANGVTFTVADSVKALDSHAIIVAAYDADGKLAGNITVGEDSVTVAPVEGAVKYVGFVWNTAFGLVPISGKIAVDAR